MIDLLFTPEACHQECAVIVVGLRNDDVALDRTASDSIGQIKIPKTENKGKLNKRLEIVLG